MTKPVKNNNSMLGARYDWEVRGPEGLYDAGWSRWCLISILMSYKCYWSVVLRRYALVKLIDLTLMLQKRWPILANKERIIRWYDP